MGVYLRATSCRYIASNSHRVLIESSCLCLLTKLKRSQVMLPDSLRNRRLPKSKKPSTPLWKGPQVDGVTQSLLGRFLVCRERFRLLVVEGLKPSGGWNHRTGYGDMWHICEEAAASEVRHFDGELSGVDTLLWSGELEEYATELVKRYPLDRDRIEHWYMVCKVQFPEYTRHWMKHPDNVRRAPLFQEEEFCVRYQLPSGRTVLLRGKWDSVDLIKEGKTSGVWLQENKTKGDVNPAALQQQLRFDLQTMFYLVALQASKDEHDKKRGGLVQWSRLGDNSHKTPIMGVRYNVVRRPLSGGKGSIVRHKATKNKPQESVAHFYGRVAQVIKDNPENFFFRWKSVVTAKDIEVFKKQCLDVVLEQLCDWWSWVTLHTDPFVTYESGDDITGCHFRFPYGVYNPLTEGVTGDLDSYLDTGSTTGLVCTDNLFPELHNKEQSE